MLTIKQHITFAVSVFFLISANIINRIISYCREIFAVGSLTALCYLLFFLIITAANKNSNHRMEEPSGQLGKVAHPVPDTEYFWMISTNMTRRHKLWEIQCKDSKYSNTQLLRWLFSHFHFFFQFTLSYMT